MSISAINGVSQSFTSNVKPKKEKIYQRTDAFKIAGASAGAALTVVGLIASCFKSISGNVHKGYLALAGLGVTAGLALVGTICDFTINKIVKNTVLSLRQTEEKGEE